MMNMRQQAERFGTTIVDDEVLKVDFKNPHSSHQRILKVMKAEQYYSVQEHPRENWVLMGNKSLVEEVFHIVLLVMDHSSKAEIAVIGGDTAIEEATFLTKFGKSVKIIP